MLSKAFKKRGIRKKRVVIKKAVPTRAAEEAKGKFLEAR
jgi:hypothetical protein